jgi:RimJ/RimL family protein N-acetyltransferase
MCDANPTLRVQLPSLGNAADVHTPLVARLSVFWNEQTETRLQESAVSALARLREGAMCCGVELVLDAEGIAVGGCGIVRIPGLRLGVIHYGVEPPYRGRRLATMAVAELLAIARWMDLLRVKAHVEIDNRASLRVLQRHDFHCWDPLSERRPPGPFVFSRWLV